MKSILRSAIFIILTTALTVYGLPHALDTNSTSIVNRGTLPIVGVYYCTGPNWTGDCTHEMFELQSCVALPAGIMSIGTDPGAGCQFYSTPDCGHSGAADFFEVTSPGCANVPAADPPVSAWSGSVDCLAVSDRAENLCVLFQGHG